MTAIVRPAFMQYVNKKQLLSKTIMEVMVAADAHAMQ